MSKLKISDARLSFPVLFEAQQFNGEGTPKFRATFMLDPNNKQHAKQIKGIKAAIDECARAKWGKQWDAKKIKLKGTCLKAQDDDLASEDLVTETEGEYREEFEGVYLFAASETKRPSLVDADRTPLVKEDGKPYAGCYVTAIVSLWAQDNAFGKRVNANLIGVQFKKDGDPFEARTVVADDDWDDFDDDDMLD